MVVEEFERGDLLDFTCHFVFLLAFKHGFFHVSHTLFYYFCIRERLLVFTQHRCGDGEVFLLIVTGDID